MTGTALRSHDGQPAPGTAPTPIDLTADTPRWRRQGLRPTDRLTTGLANITVRPARTLLTALGIAIGIASMVTIVGISASSTAALLDELDEIGTNLLQVRPGTSAFGEASKLPEEAEPMLGAVATVSDTAGVTAIDTRLGRNRFDDTPHGLSVMTTDGSLTPLLKLELEQGRPIDEQTQQLPVAVLGSVAAERLGITDLTGGPTVDVAGNDVQVIGIMASHLLHPDIDRTVLIGHRYAVDELGIDANHTAIYLRVDPDRIAQTRPLLARTANPADPNEVDVSRPSDSIEAQAKVDQSLRNVLIALGGVALLVGAIGIANMMVISVIERRSEIGLRRALGATRGNIRTQFVIEAAALAALGGALGIAIGSAATVAVARWQGWTVAIPLQALALGVLGALLLGGIAGLYPAAKAARLDPAEAIRPPA